ncbi:MAG: DNA adenine methylase [Prevotella sp.]|nr:DNA adenine methylase [Prevotella sp.]
MKYKGSKARIVDEILPIMLQSMIPGLSFVDAFCGGCSVIQRVPKEYRRIANDNNHFLVAMMERLTTTDWEPPTYISKPYYDKVRASYNANDGQYDDALVGWVGFMASRNGRFFDGGYSGHDSGGRDYIAENIRNINRQIEELRGIEWYSGDYSDIPIPPNSLIYCDPPYKGTSGYSTARGFDYECFYDWCREKKKEGHQVFISEYQMPSDFECVWEKELTNSLNPTKTYKPTERLWTIK